MPSPLTLGARSRKRIAYQRMLLDHFGLRQTTSIKVITIIPNYKDLTKEQIYERLDHLYRNPPKKYLATITRDIGTDRDRFIDDYPNNIIVRNENEYINLLKAYFLDKIQTPRESPKPPKRIRIKALYYTTENDENGDEFLNNFKQIFIPLIRLEEIQQSVDTQPLLQSKPISIEHTTNSDYNLTYDNLCVFNEILTKFPTHKGCRSLGELMNTTINACKEIDLYENDGTTGNLIYPVKKTEITYDTIIKYGINKKILIAICEALKITLNLFVYHFTENSFKLVKEQYTNDKNNHRLFYCLLENNHLYMFDTLNTIRLFNKTIQTTQTQTHTHHKAKQMDKTNLKKVFNTDELSEIDFLKKSGIPFRLNYTNNNLRPYIIKDTIYYPKVDIELRNYIGETYEGETNTSIANSYLKGVPTNTLTETIYKALNADGVKHRTHADNLFPNDDYFTTKKWNEQEGCLMPNEKYNIQKFDINKCHTHSMMTLPYIYDTDITSNIVVAKNNSITEDGLYYVNIKKTNNLTNSNSTPFGGVPNNNLTNSTCPPLLHGDNWYSMRLLQEARENGECFKVKYYIKLNKIKNPFPEIIAKIKQDFPNKGETKPAKNIINNMSGLCGITKRDKLSLQFTTDTNKIMRFLETATNPYIKREEDGWFYGFLSTQPLYDNRLITYILILDQANLIPHQAMKQIGGRCIARNVDAFYMLEPVNIQTSDEVGGYKREEFKPLRTHKKDRNVKYNYTPPTINQHGITDGANLTADHIKNGLMICGIGGTGKTTAINRIIDDIGRSKFLIGAPTHTACGLLDGNTIHNLLSINPQTNEALYPPTDCEYFVIDECSMITTDMWRHLIQYKKQNKQLKYILLGDRHQLPSVETTTYDFNTTEAILELVNHNYTELTRNYRQNDEGVKMSEHLIKHKRMPTFIPSKPTYDGVNICFLNKTRQSINEYRNKLDMREAVGTIKQVELNEVCPSVGYLYRGVPVICNKTEAKTDFYNGERYIIAEINQTHIILEGGRTIGYELFSKCFTLNYATTIYKAQGQTYTGKVEIHDMKVMCSNYRFIYTAISRATEYKNIKYIV